jgi:hypothetical protein
MEGGYEGFLPGALPKTPDQRAFLGDFIKDSDAIGERGYCPGVARVP